MTLLKIKGLLSLSSFWNFSFVFSETTFSFIITAGFYLKLLTFYFSLQSLVTDLCFSFFSPSNFQQGIYVSFKEYISYYLYFKSSFLVLSLQTFLRTYYPLNCVGHQGYKDKRIPVFMELTVQQGRWLWGEPTTMLLQLQRTVAEKPFQKDSWYVKSGSTKQASLKTMTSVSFSSQLCDPGASCLQLKEQIKGMDFYLANYQKRRAVAVFSCYYS